MKLDVTNLKFGEIEYIAGRLERRGAIVCLKREGERLLMVAN